MIRITAKNASQQDFMPLMRELVRAFQAFAAFDANLHRTNGSGLTVSQADVVFTLGNTSGMTCGEIGERTLITKGTLTGVIDRLVAKNLVRREKVRRDGRCTRIILTAEGQQLFEEVFPTHITEMRNRFHHLDRGEMETATRLLARIRRAFE